ncbi:recombinase family protein [Sphingomonas sp. 1185]|uniref:recombinase family protein n=1 Tax=Sphingomonas sp. 1185 TaxID=3156411 RepID=UPI003391E146
MTISGQRRVALYGRHSTALQAATSPDDQVAACAPLVNFLGGRVVATWLDPEISGYRRDCPGLRALLSAVEAGDLVVHMRGALSCPMSITTRRDLVPGGHA